jgi:glycosyltransferase involved in cell wall biosynthesis
MQIKITIASCQAFSLVNFKGSLIKELLINDVEVYALAPDFDDEIRKQILELGAKPVDFSMSRTGMNPFFDFIDTIKLVCILRQLKPNIIFVYAIKPVIFGTLAAWLARVPRRVALIAGLGYVFPIGNCEIGIRRRMLQKIATFLYRIALDRSHKVIFLNPDDEDEFSRKNIVSPQKVVNIGGIGVDLEEWSLTPPVLNPVTFLLAARLLREKGIVEFAEAARLVKLRYPDTRFILLGGVDSNPGCLSIKDIHAWVAQGLLEWPGHVSVKTWYAQASVFVLPSYYREGVPRTTQEAMAMGRPVITTDVPGCRETVDEGENGFLVPVRNPAALAGAMYRFIEQPGLIRTMGITSRAMAEQRFDVRPINRRIIACLLNK